MIVKRISYIAQILLYTAAVCVLIFFLYKNNLAYEEHMTDLRNSAGKPLTVGAELPAFTMTNIRTGEVIDSTTLDRYVLVVSSPECPYTRQALGDIKESGSLAGLTDIYVVFTGSISDADLDYLITSTESYENFTICVENYNSVKWGFKDTASPTIYASEDGKVFYKSIGV